MAVEVDEDFFSEIDSPDPGLRKKRAPDSTTFSALRNFPKVICEICRREFPEARTNTDAVVAYMASFCPEIADNDTLRKEVMTEEQNDLVKGHSDGDYAILSERMNRLSKKMDKTYDMAYDIYLATMLSLSQRADMPSGITNGGGKAYVNDPGWHVTEEFFNDFVKFYEPMFEQYRREREISEGRPAPGMSARNKENGKEKPV